MSFYHYRYVIKEHCPDLTFVQRSQIVWAILNRTRYENDSAEKVGIQRLIAKNVYKAAYPLHDGEYDYHDKNFNSAHLNERRVSTDRGTVWKNEKFTLT